MFEVFRRIQEEQDKAFYKARSSAEMSTNEEKLVELYKEFGTETVVKKAVEMLVSQHGPTFMEGLEGELYEDRDHGQIEKRK